MPAFTLLDADNKLTNTVITCRADRIDEFAAGASYINGAYPARYYQLDANGEPQPFVTPEPPRINHVERILAELTSHGYAVDVLLPPEDEWSIDDACLAIDLAAGRARARVTSQGAYVADEYRLTQQQVKEWRTNGSDPQNPPATLQSWMDANNWDAATAAANIEQAAANMEQVTIAIRDLRLKGKAAVKAANGDHASTARSFIEQLNGVPTV